MLAIANAKTYGKVPCTRWWLGDGMHGCAVICQCVSRLLHMYVRFGVFVYGALLLAPADNMHGDAACAPFFFLVRQAQPKHRLFLDD